MRLCPNCNAGVSPFRLVLVTRWTPYKCPHCSRTFQRVLLPAVFVYTVTSALMVNLALQVGFRLFGVLIIFAGIIFMFLLDWLVMPWKQIDQLTGRGHR